MKFKTIITIILFLLSGCANPIIGKSAKPHLYFSQSGNGHKSIRHKHIILDFDYTINKQKNEISFDGSLNCNKNSERDWYFADIKLRLIFINSENLIMAEEPYFTLDSEHFCNPKIFKGTYPYNEDYIGMIIGYDILLRE